MQITYFGHSCFQVTIKGKKILFDPFIRGNELASHIKVEDIKPDYILISHGHNDHLADAVEIARNSNATVVACYEVAEWLNKQGVKMFHPMNVGGKWMFDFGKVKCVTAVHSSGLPDGSYGGVAMGFILETDEGNFYYSGDTALTYDMKLIGEFRSLDFAFLCLGDNFTMSVDNAIIASDFIKCNQIIGMHYNTFGYIKIDEQDAINRFKHAGKNLNLMPIGGTIQSENLK